MDSNTVGWYQTTHLGQSENSVETVEVQISDHMAIGMNGINLLSELYTTGQCVCYCCCYSFCFLVFIHILVLIFDIMIMYYF